jgi:hypothetical protein
MQLSGLLKQLHTVWKQTATIPLAKEINKAINSYRTSENCSLYFHFATIASQLVIL